MAENKFNIVEGAVEFTRKHEDGEKKGESSDDKNPTTEIEVLPADQFYSEMKTNVFDVPILGDIMNGLLRNMIRITSESWTRRFGALPCLHGKNHLWLQLLLVDEQGLAQVKLYALGSRVALTSDDTDIIKRSRYMFKEAAPFLLNDTGLWVFSRSLVHKGFDGVIDDAIEFPSYDPVGGLLEPPQDDPSNVLCTEVFVYSAGVFNLKDNAQCTRNDVMELLEGLNAEEGICQMHAFSVVAASVQVSREKLKELKGQHLTA